MDSRTGSSHFYIEENWEELSLQFREIGYTFVFLPDLADYLAPELMQYMFPGINYYPFIEDMYQHIQDFAGLEDRTGFLYKTGGETYFFALPEEASEISQAIGLFLDELRESSPKNLVCSSDSALGTETTPSLFDSEELCYDFFKGRCFAPPGPPDLEDIRRLHPYLLACESDFPSEGEDTPEGRTQRIIRAWEKIEQEFGISIQDLDIILSYRVKPSHLNIDDTGRIFLADWNEGTEVKMDDLSKAVYFFYLRHPEGARLKELLDHEEEIFSYYLNITCREDIDEIRKSVHNLLDPYANGLNVCLSRIKKAFKDIVGDRIARFYYIDGQSGENRSIRLDRNLVRWGRMWANIK